MVQRNMGNETVEGTTTNNYAESNVGDVMVVGGGISGIQASLDLAESGFKVYLVESLPAIGGKMSQLDKTFPTNDCSMCIESPKFIECDRHPNIQILTYTVVKSVEGEAGDFKVTIAKNNRNYCSRVCCSQAVRNAIKLKELNPEMDIYILYRDLRTYGFQENYYREAGSRGVKFIRYEPDDKPYVENVEEDGQYMLRVTVTDPVLGERIAIDADILALAAAIIPSAGSQEISRLFKLPLNQDGFFQEAHVKLRPVEFSAEGIFLCGAAHYPKHISETVSQAYGASGRATTVLSKDSVTASGAVCVVNEDDCVGCGQCESVCGYQAIKIHNTPQGKKARVISVLCKGCGVCSTKCPTGAIRAKHYTDAQILAEIDTAFPALVEAL